YWGYPVATLLAPPPADGKIPPPESNVNDGRTAPPAAGHPRPPDAGRAHPTAHAGEDSKEEDVMQRRTVLRALAGLATLTTPAFTTEGPRFDTGPDEWESIAATYATLYYALPPAELINRLSAEMAALEHKAAGKDQTSLCRVAAQLSAVMALALVASHRLPLARRWWQNSRRYADQSGDPETRAGSMPGRLSAAPTNAGPPARSSTWPTRPSPLPAIMFTAPAPSSGPAAHRRSPWPGTPTRRSDLSRRRRRSWSGCPPLSSPTTYLCSGGPRSGSATPSRTSTPTSA